MLEVEIVKLREAVKENTSFLKSMTAKAGTKAETKPAAEEKKPGRPAKGAAKVKAPTAAEMKAVGEAFVNVDDEDEYKERRAALVAIAEHFGAEKFSGLESADRATAVQLVELAKAGDLDLDDIKGAVASLEGGDEKPSRRDDDI